jgi:hypothetical protein
MRIPPEDVLAHDVCKNFSDLKCVNMERRTISSPCQPVHKGCDDCSKCMVIVLLTHNSSNVNADNYYKIGC